MFAPIVIFAYNRPGHTAKLIKSLLLNNESEGSDLYVFCDGAKNPCDENVKQVRDLVNQISGFKSITKVFRDTNIGLANNIIQGVSEVFEKHDKVIVLEDDLIATPHFLRYINQALDFYDDKDIFSIAGYTPNVEIPDNYAFTTYPILRNCSWGWATWRRRWQSVDWDVEDFKDFISDKEQKRRFSESGSDLVPMLLKQQTGIINSWSIRFCYSAFKQNLPTIYPTQSFIINDGADGSGTNVNSTKKYDTTIFDGQSELNFCTSTIPEKEILKSFKKTYDCSIQRQIINYFKIQKYLRHK